MAERTTPNSFEGGNGGEDQLLSIDLGNYAEQLEELEQFDDLERRIALNNIVRIAVRPVNTAARQEVPRGELDKDRDKKRKTSLRKSIGVKIKEYPGVAFATVGPRHDKGGPHGHLVHWGHRIVVGGTGWNVRKLTYARNGKLVVTESKSYAKVSRRTGVRGGGRVRGMTKENRFMDRAIETASGRVESNLEKAITQAINKLWRGKSTMIPPSHPAFGGGDD